MCVCVSGLHDTIGHDGFNETTPTNSTPSGLVNSKISDFYFKLSVNLLEVLIRRTFGIIVCTIGA